MQYAEFCRLLKLLGGQYRIRNLNYFIEHSPSLYANSSSATQNISPFFNDLSHYPVDK
jgi:hypothetical protein